MSFLYFGNTPASVPPVFDTTPCMKEMLNYQDCIYDANIPSTEVVHPAWPTMWPRLETDGKTVEYQPEKLIYQTPYDYQFLRPLTKKNKQFLWECEEQRFVFKACLRKLSTLQRSVKHTSWDTAPVSNLQLTNGFLIKTIYCLRSNQIQIAQHSMLRQFWQTGYVILFIQLLMYSGIFTNNHASKKQYLETCELAHIRLQKQQIKIPFMCNLAEEPKLHSMILKSNQKVEQIPVIKSLSRKYSFIIEHLCSRSQKNTNNANINNGLILRRRSQIDRNKIQQSMSIPVKAHQTKQNQEQRKDVSPAYKYQKYLPSINLKQIHLRPRKSTAQSRRQKIERKLSRESKLKLSMLKKCYDVQAYPVDPNYYYQSQPQSHSHSNSKYNYNSRNPSTRRLKTEQQSNNQALLERILTVKPSLQLRRDLLKLNFRKNNGYKRIKQSKNMSWNNSIFRPPTRSRTTNSVFS